MLRRHRQRLKVRLRRDVLDPSSRAGQYLSSADLKELACSQECLCSKCGCLLAFSHTAGDVPHPRFLSSRAAVLDCAAVSPAPRLYRGNSQYLCARCNSMKSQLVDAPAHLEHTRTVLIRACSAAGASVTLPTADAAEAERISKAFAGAEPVSISEISAQRLKQLAVPLTQLQERWHSWLEWLSTEGEAAGFVFSKPELQAEREASFQPAAALQGCNRFLTAWDLPSRQHLECSCCGKLRGAADLIVTFTGELYCSTPPCYFSTWSVKAKPAQVQQLTAQLLQKAHEVHAVCAAEPGFAAVWEQLLSHQQRLVHQEHRVAAVFAKYRAQDS